MDYSTSTNNNKTNGYSTSPDERTNTVPQGQFLTHGAQRIGLSSECIESSAVPVSQSSLAEPCLDTDNMNDQLLSVRKQIHELEASIEASVASYRFHRQTPSVEERNVCDKGTLLHVIGREVLQPSTERILHNMSNADGDNSDSTQELSDYSHISRHNKDSKKDVSPGYRRLRSVVQRKSDLERGRCTNNRYSLRDLQSPLVDCQSRGRYKENHRRSTRRDSNTSRDSESAQSDDYRGHRQAMHCLRSTSRRKPSSTVQPKAKCIPNSSCKSYQHKKIPSSVISASENSDAQCVYDSESDYSVDKYTNGNLNKDKFRHSCKSKKDCLTHKAKIRDDVWSSDSDAEYHSRRSVAGRKLPLEENRLRHRYPSRRHARDSGSPHQARRRRSKHESRRSRKHWIKPDRYDGSSSLEAFLAHFDSCATYNRWHDDDRLAYLRSCLTGRAAEVLWAAGGNASDTLDKLMKLLRNRFGNDGQAEKHRAELRCRRRRAGESLRSVFHDIQRLVSLAYPGPTNATTEIVARDAFLDSLDDCSFAMKVREKEPCNLDEALKIALRLEAYSDRGDGSLNNRPRHARGANTTDSSRNAELQRKINQLEDERRITDKRMNDLEVALQATGIGYNNGGFMPASQHSNVPSMSVPMIPQQGSHIHNQRSGRRSNRYQAQSSAGCPSCRLSDGTRVPNCQVCRQQGCFLCGSLDHWKKDCMLNSKHNSGGHAVTNTSPAHANWIKNRYANGDVYLQMQLGNQRVDCLIDTGCEITMIPYRFVNMQYLLPCDQKVFAANGSEIRIQGTARVNFSLNGLPTSADALISEDIELPMLGSDWLHSHNCYWDFTRHLLYVDGQALTLNATKTHTRCRRVYVQDEVVLPPHHQVVAPVRTTCVSLRSPSSDSVIEPKELRPGLFLARALLPDRQHNVPVQLINSTNEPQRLKAGICLGQLQPVYVCDGRESLSNVNELNAVSTDDGTFEEMVQQLPEQLTTQQRFQATELLRKYENVFSKNEYDIGQTDLVEYHIDTGSHRPIRQPLRRHPIAHQQIIDEHVDRMLAQGIVEPAASPWTSNVVLVRKKDGQYRFCIDYRRLNAVTYPDAYPLPRIESCLDALDGSSWFSTLDLRSGYWQVKQNPQDADKTAFITRRGCFRFRVLSFGLTNAPSVFQRLMDLVLSGLTWEICLVYIDDVIVFARSFGEQVSRLETVLQRLQNARLKLKPGKCCLFRREVKFLGYIVSKQGIRTDPAKVSAVTTWSIPQNLTELRAFLGLCSYYRRFVHGFADVAAPLHELTKKGRCFTWDTRCQAAFDELKRRLTSAPILGLPRNEGTYYLDTDASEESVGAILSQLQDGEERVIAYSSRRISDVEKRYSTTRKELLAVVFGLRQYRQYLLGRRSVLRTDHAALQSLRRTPEPVGQAGRWLDFIEQFDLVVKHRAGAQHRNADALSRRPVDGNDFKATTACAVNSENSQMEDIWAPAALASAQASDKEFGSLYLLRLNSDDPPPISAVQRCGEECKVYLAQWPQLCMHDNVLYRRFLRPDGTTQSLQLIPPVKLRQEIIRLAHSGMTGGHLGLKKTLDQVARRCYWKGWRSDVNRFVRSCQDCCRYHRGPPPKRGALQDMSVGAPMERWEIDLTGPHPRSRKGNIYILTCIDQFTKWAEAIALPNKEAVTVSRVLMEQVFSRFGFPIQLLSDQGKEFDSIVLRELCRLMGIDKVRTSCYKPSTNGCVERLHRTINGMIGRVISESQREWDELLPSVMAAYRSSRHEATGLSPNYLTFGREVRAPLDVVLGPPEDRDLEASVDDFVNKMHDRLVTAYEIAREQLQVTADRSKHYYDLRVRPVEISVGSWVWMYSPRKYVGRSPKWQKNYSGPFLVEDRLSDVLYRIRRSRKANSLLVHRDKLKPYCGDAPTTWLPAAPAVSTPNNEESDDARPKRSIRRPSRFNDF